MIAKNKVTEITQIVFMVWVFVFNVVRAFHVYSVADVKRCLAEKPAIVESTNKLSTFTTWKTTA